MLFSRVDFEILYCSESHIGLLMIRHLSVVYEVNLMHMSYDFGGLFILNLFAALLMHTDGLRRLLDYLFFFFVLLFFFNGITVHCSRLPS